MMFWMGKVVHEYRGRASAYILTTDFNPLN